MMKFELGRKIACCIKGKMYAYRKLNKTFTYKPFKGKK